MNAKPGSGIPDTDAFRRAISHVSADVFSAVKFRIIQNRRLRIAFLGGSISSGALASQKGLGFAPRLIEKLRQTHPQCKFAEINAGESGTGSYLGIFRLQQDVLERNPDLVILEFAVNDGEGLHEKAAYENIIRSLHAKNIPVLAFYLTTSIGTTRQNWQNILAKHYDIPALSYHDAIFPLISNGTLAWDSISADNIHPNDTGHEIIASLLHEFIEGNIHRTGDAKEFCGVTPAPLYGLDFMETAIFQYGNKNGAVKLNHGFEKLTNPSRRFFPGDGFWANSDNAEIEIEFNGTSLGLIYHLSGNPQFGETKISVDDLPAIRIAAFDPDQSSSGRWPPLLIQGRLTGGKHTARIQIQKAPGTLFEIHAFLIGRGAGNPS